MPFDDVFYKYQVGSNEITRTLENEAGFWGTRVVAVSKVTGECTLLCDRCETSLEFDDDFFGVEGDEYCHESVSMELTYDKSLRKLSAKLSVHINKYIYL